jgi:prepilin-type N-terminal cleavage/methylation domain-containing protein
MQNTIKSKRFQAFTLIEVLIVTAMISVLAAAILVSISSQREKARLSKVLAEVSGTIQPMMMCWSDGGEVNKPTGQGGAICNINDTDDTNYGTWPDLSDTGWSYEGNIISSNNWSVAIKDGGNTLICCNSASMKCAESSSCGADTPL